MSRYKYVLFSIITFGLFTLSANAASCSYEQRAELNSEISNITANYEVIEVPLEEGATPPDALLESEEEEYTWMIEALQINILNLTENVYVEVTNNYDNQTTVYNYSDTDNGNIAIEWRTLGELVTYTIRVYASSATDCADTLLRTLRVSLPRYNDYATYAVCDQVPDYYLCQRYVFFDQVDFNEFSTKVLAEIERVEQEEEQNNEEDTTWYEEVGNFISEHKTPIIIGVVSILVIAGVIVVIVVIRRRRSEI